MTTDRCSARLYDAQRVLTCHRFAEHYNKPHRATDAWATSDGRLVDVEMTWPVGADEWAEATDTADACACSHGLSLHGPSGRCSIFVCGCTRVRPAGVSQ